MEDFKFDEFDVESADTESTPVEVEGEDAVVVPEAKVAEVTSGINFDLSKIGLNVPGVMIADTGTKVSRFPIERIKFTVSKKDRISILSDQVIIVRTHFDEDLGSFICFGGSCCDHFGLSSVRYVFPVVHYESTNSKGTPLSADIEVKVLAVGKDSYEELLTILENKGSLTQFDIVVTCTDEGYQKVSFTEAGPAQWQRAERLIKFVDGRLKKDGKNLVAALGREFTEEKFNKAIGEDVAPGFDETQDLSSIFGK